MLGRRSSSPAVESGAATTGVGSTSDPDPAARLESGRAWPSHLPRRWGQLAVRQHQADTMMETTK